MKPISFALLVVLLLAAVPAVAGDKVALVVGVDRYRDEELPSLEFADDDAQALGEALAQLGFDVVTMTSAAEKVSLHPDTPEDIRASLDRRLKACERDDVVVVCLSGHGVQLVGDAPRPDGTRETWFCPAKARLDDPATLLGISEVIGLMAACPAARKLLIVDACRNDMKPPGAGKARDVIVRELDPAAPARRSMPEGMVTLFSCSPRERSFELQDMGHSVFSHHVIEYLAGRADDPARFYEDGEATLTDLVAYATKRTQRSAEKVLAASQTPESVGRMTDWSLGKVAGIVVTNSLGMKLVRIPAGQFEMGSDERDNEKPVHLVRITKPFLVGQTEVTQGQWQKVMGTTPWKGKENVKEGPNVATDEATWDDAVEFCRRLTELEGRAGTLPAGRSYRLPTEAEWEYACRAGTKTKWSFGDDEKRLGEYAWYKANARDMGQKHAHEVGLKQPNPWKLFDTYGNVPEWCSDWYDGKYYATSPAADPKGPDSTGPFHVVRGGHLSQIPDYCDSADRSGGSWALHAGFRVVCELE